MAEIQDLVGTALQVQQLLQSLTLQLLTQVQLLVQDGMMQD